MDNVREKLVARRRGERCPSVEVRGIEELERAGISVEHNPDVTSICYRSAYVEVGHDSHCQRNIHEYVRTHPIDGAGPSRVNPRVPCTCSNSRNGMLMRVEDPAVAAQLITEGASVNYRDGNGFTPLHLSRNVEIAALLLENGADINCTDCSGHTPLHYARTCEIAAYLRDHGADIHARGIYRSSELRKLAIESEVNTQRMAVIIERGANIDALNHVGQTPLHEAVNWRKWKAVATLLYYNADPLIRDDCRFTPIMYNILGRNYQNVSDRLIYEMLLGYEDSFTCSANDDSAVLTLAVLSKSPYVDEMIGLGVDFSNLRRELSVLLWCIHQPDIEEFKWFWDIFDYKKSWNYYNPILEYLFRKGKYSAFDYVLESPKMKVVVEVQCRNEYAAEYLLDYDEHHISPVTLPSNATYLVRSNITISMVLDATTSNRYDESKAEQIIFVLLSYGYVASEEDAHRIFKLYGYGPLFELLLHLGVERNKRRRKSRRNVPLSVPEALLNPKKAVRDFVIKGASVHEREVFFMGEGVPSLLELSRNQARVAIWNGYKMQNIKQFYTTIKWMDIPPLIKDILTLKLPIYDPQGKRLCPLSGR